MSNKLIHLRLPNNLHDEADKIIKEFGFSNIQEFIKESLRKNILEYKMKKRALKKDEK